MGLVWIWQSQSLSYWSEFAPGSGFLPFWLGAALVVLTGICLAGSLRRTAPTATLAEPRQPARVATIAIGFVFCIAVIEQIGFVVAATLYLAFLIGVVERRSLLETVLVPLLTSIGLWLIFKQWLKVPFPQGPWGF